MFPLSEALRRRPKPPPSDDGEDEEKDDIDAGDEEEFQGYVIPQPRLHVTHDGQLEEKLLVRTEGWLYKKGGAVNQRGGRKNWKKRWFVLAPFDFLGQSAYELQYYDKAGGSLKGSVGLSDVVIFCEARTKHHKIKYEFQLNLPNGGTLELSCDDATEREEWIETINMCIAFMRTLTHPAAMVLNGYDPLDEEDQEIFQMGEEIAANCQAYGPGLYGSEAGKREQFVLQIYDVAGQQVTRGGMPVSCTISNDEAMYYVKVHDNGDGTFAAYYMLGRPGRYKLHIRINDEHDIDGSPFDIEVLPSKTVASCSTAEGEALTALYPERQCSFTIVARDCLGNKKQRGGDPFEVSILGPAVLESIDDNGDGSYVVCFEAQDPAKAQYFASNTLRINVTLYGKHIEGSPFRPIILDAPERPEGDRGDLLEAMFRGEPEQTSVRGNSFFSAGAGGGGGGGGGGRGSVPTVAAVAPAAAAVESARDDRSAAGSSQERVALGAQRARERAALKRQQAAGGGSSSSIAEARLGLDELSRVSGCSAPSPVLATPAAAPPTALRGGSVSGFSAAHTLGTEALSLADKGLVKEDLLGGLRGGPGPQATDEDRLYWSQCQAASTSADVVNILLTKVAVLKQGFDLVAQVVDGARVLVLPQAKRLLQEYQVCPLRLSERDVTVLFSLMASAQALARPPLPGLDFCYYLRFLVCVGLFCVNKNPALSQEHASLEAKVDVLIGEWGLGDRTKVAILKSKLRDVRR